MPDVYNLEDIAKLLSFGYGGITIAVLLGILRYFWQLLDKERQARIEILERRAEEVKSYTEAITKLTSYTEVIAKLAEVVKVQQLTIDQLKFLLDRIDKK